MSVFQAIRHSMLAPLTRAYYSLDARKLPADVMELPYDAPVRLVIPTYDGSWQPTHPDILPPRAPGQPYALVMTPYPYDIDRYENPSILVAPDGLRFREERKGINPLVPPPERDHNDDPDLSYRNGEYQILYLETLRPERQNLVLLRSEDRLTWRPSNAATFELTGANRHPFIVSPALAEREGLLYLYYVDRSSDPNRIEYLTGRDVADWGGREASAAVFDRLPVVPWHIDIASSGGAHYMLISAAGRRIGGVRTYDLYIASSENLSSWRFRPEPVFPRRPFGFRDVYRSTAFVDRDDLFIYFACRSRLFEWKIGVVRKRLADLFPSGPEAAT